jgi:hypothetical protein
MNKKSLLTCALLAAGIISQASAVNVVYLTGSTAFRSTAYATLHSSAGPAAGGVFDIPGTVVGGNLAPAITEAERGGTSQSGANYMLFRGNINGADTFLDCAWNGSEAGVAAVANVAIDNDGAPLFGAPCFWLKADGTVAMNGYAGGSDANHDPLTTELENGGLAPYHIADIALADTSQASSAPTTRTVPLKAYGQVCVVTFTWVKNQNTASGASAAKTAWSRLSNVTKPVLINEFSVVQTADNFTGVAADSTTPVYLVGRNKGSGTRANVLLDSTVGIDTLINQYAIGQAPDGGISGNNPDGTLHLWFAADANGGADNGYESGGSVAAALGAAGSTSQADPINGYAGWMAIGYLGVSDAVKSGLTVANNWLTEDGVMESNGAIENGQYTYWGYENLYGRNGINGYQDTDAGIFYNSLLFNLNAVVDVAANHDAGIPVGRMNCSKSTDASFPSHN